jgi:hypothetical protein
MHFAHHLVHRPRLQRGERQQRRTHPVNLRPRRCESPSVIFARDRTAGISLFILLLAVGALQLELQVHEGNAHCVGDRAGHPAAISCSQRGRLLVGERQKKLGRNWKPARCTPITGAPGIVRVVGESSLRVCAALCVCCACVCVCRLAGLRVRVSVCVCCACVCAPGEPMLTGTQVIGPKMCCVVLRVCVHGSERMVCPHSPTA